jgi:hypothetical protein
MIINPIDRSNYFKGLLVLAGQDKEITKNKKVSLKKIAATLGFDLDFADNAIDNFFMNKYIIEDPPLFSHNEITEIFIKDGIRLAFTDEVLNLHQIEWLTATALKNKLSKQWLFIELENFLDNHGSSVEMNFEIQKCFDNKFKGVRFLNVL